MNEGLRTSQQNGIIRLNYLKVIVIPSTMTSFVSNFLLGSGTLVSGGCIVICKANTPPTLGSTPFNSANIGKIYVPDESVDTYKATTGWSGKASIIYGKSDLPSEYAEYWP